MADLANSDLRRTLDKSSGQRRARIPASAEQGTILTSGEQRPVPSDRRVSTLAAASALPRRCPCMFTRVCTRGPRVCVCICKVYVSTCIDLVYLPPFLCVYVFLCMCECALCTHCTVIAQFRQKTPKSADCVYYFLRSLRRTALRGRPPAGQKRRDGQGLGHSFRPGNSRGGRGGGGRWGASNGRTGLSLLLLLLLPLV